jgi:tricorn protease-like protein
MPHAGKGLLNHMLDGLEDKSHLKFEAFKKGRFSLDGHSMLIRKTGDSYSFFDPNRGEFTQLSIDDLCELINESMRTYKANHMCFLDAKSFTADLRKKMGTDYSPFIDEQDLIHDIQRWGDEELDSLYQMLEVRG